MCSDIIVGKRDGGNKKKEDDMELERLVGSWFVQVTMSKKMTLQWVSDMDIGIWLTCTFYFLLNFLSVK